MYIKENLSEKKRNHKSYYGMRPKYVWSLYFIFLVNMIRKHQLLKRSNLLLHHSTADCSSTGIITFFNYFHFPTIWLGQYYTLSGRAQDGQEVPNHPKEKMSDLLIPKQNSLFYKSPRCMTTRTTVTAQGKPRAVQRRPFVSSRQGKPRRVPQ